MLVITLSVVDAAKGARGIGLGLWIERPGGASGRPPGEPISLSIYVSICVANLG